MTRWLLQLTDPAAADPDLVGGKAAGLNALARAGQPVPDAFVVTTEAFHAHFPPSAFDADSAPALPPLQPALQDALAQLTSATFDPDADQFAVRSSAIGEDGSRDSFAGQHATYYFIRRADLGTAIARCWLSLWSPHALAYRRHRRPGANVAPLAMAVIVQRMVQADRAGVCFTRDPAPPPDLHGGVGAAPLSGSGSGTAHTDAAASGPLCIEATWGLGAALVDGRVSPDRLLTDRRGRILQRHIGRKRVKVACSGPAPDSPRLEPVPAHQQLLPVLDDDEVRRVTELSLAAEALFGAPQDVEWAFENGHLLILQSRPITSPPLLAGGHGGASQGQWILFKPVAENFLEPLTPMSVDLLRRVLPPIGRFIGGRLYVDFRRLRQLTPLRWSNRQLADVLLLRGPPPELPIHWGRLPLALGAGLAGYLIEGVSWSRSAHLTPGVLEQYAELCRHVQASNRYDALQAARRLFLGAHPFESIGRQAIQINVSAGRYFLLMGLLRAWLQRVAPAFDLTQLSHLCGGGEEMLSRQLIEEIRGLADLARAQPELEAIVRAESPQRWSELLATLPPQHPFTRALMAFLQRFGHRCVREIELASPRWREHPMTVLQMVRNYLAMPAETRPLDPHGLNLTAREALRRAIPRAWQRRIADHLIARIRYYVRLREDTRYYHTMGFAVLRDKLRELGTRLEESGRLRVADDVFYLHWDEARGLLNGDLDWMDVAERVRARRRQHRLDSQRAPAETINVDLTDSPEVGANRSSAVEAAAARPSGNLLTGHCASPGCVEGRVRVITDPTTGALLEPGEVLVAPYTDPAWTPLFPVAGAVVVEVGSYLSHAGTVAREYQIPCLVDVTGCVARLRDGQRVRVDAGAGHLEILEP
ncbi:MAG: PEP/pyruvate-binding domain-containing protein [Pseudomonadales bacterium]